MLDAIERRELFVLDGVGDRLQGTFHRPADRRLDSSSEPAGNKRIGVLFLNSLSLPRAASGDSSVHWAGAIAEHGFPSFRVDLRGLGDSEGQASTDLLEFINGGGFAPAAEAAVTQLVDRFGLKGMILIGHCAGSVSAVYAAAASSQCKGLILLDPYFHLPKARRRKVRETLSHWARRSRVGRLLSDACDRARNLLLKVRGGRPPGNANFALLSRWKQVAATGLPILILKAPGIKARGARPRVGEFDYIDHVVRLAGRKSRVAVEFVESADHSFANREGREAVRLHIENWLSAHFPLADFNFSGRGEGAEPTSDRCDLHDSKDAPADRCCALEGR